jgi:hypothetical protein
MKCCRHDLCSCPCTVIGSSLGSYEVLGNMYERLSSANVHDDEIVVLDFIMSDSLRLEMPSRGAIWWTTIFTRHESNELKLVTPDQARQSVSAQALYILGPHSSSSCSRSAHLAVLTMIVYGEFRIRCTLPYNYPSRRSREYQRSEIRSDISRPHYL